MRRTASLTIALALTADALGATPRVRWGAEVPPAEGVVAETWRDLETRFGEASAPDISVETEGVGAPQLEAGRQRGGRIVLSRLLAHADAEPVLRHEIAHVYLESRCSETRREPPGPGLAAAAPVVAEAFALFASGDAARRALSGERFAFVSKARDFLVSREGRLSGHEAETQEALSLVLSQPGVSSSWEAWVRKTLSACTGPAFTPARADAELFARVRSVASREPASRIDFLLVEGPSQRALATEGRLDEPRSAGSILKPSLVAAAPRLLEARSARDAAEWHCPGPPAPGEAWTWRRALVRSCNGFFLDFVPPDPDVFRTWEEEMRALGMRDVPTGMPGRIGLTSGSRLSVRQAVALYSWLAAKAPVVVDALRETARDGTLASAAEAPWFRQRGIALKTGTVRDARGAPHDAWIAAVGPRLPTGEVTFVAALHATGLAAPALLPLLRERLERALPAHPAVVRVQILGLAPFASVSLSCDDDALIARDPAGEVSLHRGGTAVPSSALRAGARYACAATPLVVSFTTSRGERRRRLYAGVLEIDDSPSGGVVSSVPLRERSARARLGSRLVLATSETAYIESTLLSEHAGGSPEVLQALALVVRHDLLVERHGGRPPCDTTHCHLFGQEDERTPRKSVRAAVSAAEGLELATAGTPAWLSFYLGGDERWSRRIPARELKAKLGRRRTPERVDLLADGVRIDEGERLACEVLRNQLRLPSCPDRAERDGTDFSFSGQGEGHGEGMSLLSAERWASSGATLRDLVALSFPGVIVVPRPSAPKGSGGVDAPDAPR